MATEIAGPPLPTTSLRSQLGSTVNPLETCQLGFDGQKLGDIRMLNQHIIAEKTEDIGVKPDFPLTLEAPFNSRAGELIDVFQALSRIQIGPMLRKEALHMQMQRCNGLIKGHRL